MRRRHRHLTLANSGALACWDARPLTDSDGTSITAWADRIASLSAARATNAPVIKVGIVGGQNVLRFGGSTSSLAITNSALTANKDKMFYIAVANSSDSQGNTYRSILGTTTTNTNNDRASIFLRQSRVEASGRRLDANSFQTVQSGTGANNNTFVVASAFFDWANAALTAYINGNGTARSGGFQTAGSTSNTNGSIEIGATQTTSNRLSGDLGMIAMVESNSLPLRRRFEHAAAYSFKISCN
jgi:hypothetical protein